MQALVALKVVEKFKKEILILLLVIVAIVIFFAVKRAKKKNKIENKVNEVVQGNTKEDEQIANTLNVSADRVTALRKIAHQTAHELGTLPTQWSRFNTENEEGAIYQLNLAKSDKEFDAVGVFYEEITQRNLHTDIKKLMWNWQYKRIKFFRP